MGQSAMKCEQEDLFGSDVGLIEDDTVLLPAIVADVAVGRWLSWLEKHDRPTFENWIARERSISDVLADKAQRIYESNARFRTAVRAKGEGGRAHLLGFMLHWCGADLLRERPDLRSKVPNDLLGCSL